MSDTNSAAAADRPQSNWPLVPYLSAWAWAGFTLALFTPALDGHLRGALRGYSLLIVLSVLLGRLVVARVRRERNRRWIPYVVVMVCAVPLWLLFERPYFYLCDAVMDFLSRTDTMHP